MMKIIANHPIFEQYHINGDIISHFLLSLYYGLPCVYQVAETFIIEFTPLQTVTYMQNSTPLFRVSISTVILIFNFAQPL